VEARDEFLNKMTSLGFFAFLKFTKWGNGMSSS
jgi:hypothetical protein